MSAGAYCAVDQGLRHPDLYGAVISIEGYGDPGEGGRDMLSTQAEFDAYSPSLYVNTMTFAHPVPVFFGVGGKSDANDRQANESLAANLEKRGQIVSFETLPNGYHTWHTARALLPDALVFISGHLKVGGAAS
jgi:S-formylglutathione hydrolase FrmB